jgi:hypothetical protein
VFILEHYLARKSFAPDRESFSNAYPDREVPNKTTIHRLVSKIRDAGSVCDRKHLLQSCLPAASIIRSIALMMEAASTSETSVNFYQTTRHNNPEDSHLDTSASFFYT